MSDPTENLDWRPLHVLRLKGPLPANEFASEEWQPFAAAGFVVRRAETLALTSEGGEAHARWARLPSGSGEEKAAADAYTQFLVMNQRMLRLCTDWQVRDGAINDHSNLVYDWKVIDRLVELDDRAGPVVERLAHAVERFNGYRPRLRTARERVEVGEREWFASPRCDSYHTVWMQLHQDLLLALGRGRESEPEPQP